MRIAIDIDSTLHPYWELLSEIARRRFGVDLPYEEQFTWGITRLKPRQLEVCVAETHSDEVIAKGRPYEGAVDAVRRWHEAGHRIHVTKPPLIGLLRRDRALAGDHRAAVRRAVLRLRQGRPLPDDRRRPAHRRL